MDNIIPPGGVNPYASHPGFDAPSCPIRITVTQHLGSAMRGGFACEITGGHCLPGEHCDSQRESARQQDEMALIFQQALARHPEKVYP